MMNIEERRKEIENLNSKILEIEKERSEKLHALMGDLKNETAKSSNLIKDFATVHFGFWDDKNLENYRQLQKQVSENRHQEVLVVKRSKKEMEMVRYLSEQRGFMPPQKNYVISLELQLGKLYGNLKFDIKNGKIILPTRKHLEGKTDFCDFGSIMLDDLNWGLVKDSIKNYPHDLPHLFSKTTTEELERLRLSESYAPRYCESSSEIIFGSKIQEYFDKCLKGKEAYSKAKELLNIK